MFRYFILPFFVFYAMSSTAQPTKKCPATIDVDVVFEFIDKPVKRDTSYHGFADYGDTRIIRLRAVDSNFVITSFNITGETTDEDIVEAPNTGSGGNLSGGARSAYWTIKKGTPIYFYCIRAKHKNGNIYTLKPLTITR